MKRILSIISIILIISSLFCLNVNAEDTNNLTYDLKEMRATKISGEVCNPIYYIPNSEYTNFVVLRNNTTSNYYLYYYKTGTTFSGTTGGYTTPTDYPLLSYGPTTLEEIQCILYLGGTYDFIETNSTCTWTYTFTYYPDIIGNKQTNAISLEADYYDWYYIQHGEYPTKNDTSEDETEEDNKEYQSGVLGWFQKLWDAIKEIPTKIGEMIDTMVSWFDTLVISVQALPDRISEWWENMTSPYITLEDGSQISAGEYALNSLNENMDKRMFFNTILNFGDRFKEFFSQDFNTPPQSDLITVDLSKGESEKLNFGDEKINLLDVSWYARYKPFVDNIISAFLWIGFIFICWRNLPNIISGQSSGLTSAYTGYVKFDENQNGRTTTTRTVNNETGEVSSKTTTRKRGK